jgi:hypothetical protein
MRFAICFLAVGAIFLAASATPASADRGSSPDRMALSAALNVFSDSGGVVDGDTIRLNPQQLERLVDQKIQGLIHERRNFQQKTAIRNYSPGRAVGRSGLPKIGRGIP